MTDIPIANARIIHVEELSLPAKEGLPAKTIIASKLLVTPLRSYGDPRLIEKGVMVVPLQLPFGKNFVIILREDDGTLPSTQGRHFKDIDEL